MKASWTLIAVAACCGASHARPASSDRKGDQGVGLIGRAATRFLTDDDPSARSGITNQRAVSSEVGNSDADLDGDSADGGARGGTTYAGWAVTPWHYTTPNRQPRYTVTAGLTGELQGVVKWTGAAPSKLMTACGAIDNPTLRLGEARGVQGAVVYIEKPAVGRATPYYARPASIGGVIVKHGCALLPAVQIVAPLPAGLAIRGDGQRTRVRVGDKALELQEGGLVQVAVVAGVTKVEGEDGLLGAAWVIGLETPYYAITDDNGRFRIDELAAGTYDVTVWQPPTANVGADGVWKYGAPIVVHRSIVVDAIKPAQLAVQLAGPLSGR